MHIPFKRRTHATTATETTTMTKTSAYSTKSTLELVTGDVVTTYGVSLRLTDRREYDNGVVAFNTEYVSGETETLGGYGRMMRAGKWTIQGNKLATWSVQQEA